MEYLQLSVEDISVKYNIKKQNMICPHCSTAAYIKWYETEVITIDSTGEGVFITYGTCPECKEVIIFLSKGPVDYNSDGDSYIKFYNNNESIVNSSKLLYPQKERLNNSEYIPKEFFDDYIEAYKVISISPKASAAINRRLLQKILHEKYNIRKKNLSDEIKEFIGIEGIPSHIIDAIDAIRQIGNFASHPMKNSKTGEIIDVEPGEAEWLLEVIEELFDFSFIQPKKLEIRRQELTKKLDSIGRLGLIKK